MNFLEILSLPVKLWTSLVVLASENTLVQLCFCGVLVLTYVST